MPMSVASLSFAWWVRIMPNRILREGIVTSSRIAKLNWAEECFYRRLMSVVDDYGRYFADPGLLRAACYPRHLSKVSDSDIEKWLQATEKAALVRVYPAEDGERYLELLDFNQQVRAKKSKYPCPPSTCVADDERKNADAHLVVSVSEDESGDDSLPAKPAGHRFAEFWSLWPSTQRKECKSKCLDVWKRKKLDDIADQILAHVAALKKTKKWLDGYEPAPLTYLNQDRFKDELPSEVGGQHPVVNTPVITSNWWETPSGIEAKGKELGINQDRFGGFYPFKLAVFEKAGNGPWRAQ